MLGNPIHVGRVLHGRTRFRIGPDAGSRRSRPAALPEEIVEPAAPGPRVVDREPWDEVRARPTANAWTPELDEAGRALNRAPRKRDALSGPLVRACSDAPCAITGKDRYDCSTRRSKAACRNDVTVKRGDIEGRVLKGVKSRLLAPPLVERFVAQVRAAWERSRKESVREAGKLKREFAPASARRPTCSTRSNGAWATGRSRSASPRTRPRMPRSRHGPPRRTWRSTPTSPTLPNFAQAYAAQVPALEEALRGPDRPQRARETSAGLIEKAALTPDPGAANGLRVEIHGDPARISRPARRRARRTPGRISPGRESTIGRCGGLMRPRVNQRVSSSYKASVYP